MLFVELVAIVVFVVLLVKYGKFRVMSKEEFSDYKKQHGVSDEFFDSWHCGGSDSSARFLRRNDD